MSEVRVVVQSEFHLAARLLVVDRTVFLLLLTLCINYEVHFAIDTGVGYYVRLCSSQWNAPQTVVIG